MKNSFRNWLKRAAMTSGGICALCCLLPLISLSIGIASLGAIVFYLEKVAFGVLALSLFGLLIWRVPKKAETSSETNCCGKSEASSDLPIA